LVGIAVPALWQRARLISQLQPAPLDQLSSGRLRRQNFVAIPTLSLAV